MSETLSEVGQAAGAAEETTIRIPRNLMGYLRETYDTREKILDWILAVLVVSTIIYYFRDEIWGCFQAPLPDETDAPDSGRHPDMQPNQNVAGAFPGGQRANPKIFTYNMPPSRNLRYGIGPSGTRPPDNPSLEPSFPETSC